VEGRFRAYAILSTRLGGLAARALSVRNPGDQMTEILTESFCERCGTRYTFESARPRARLKGVRVLSRGLKNFVLSDDTSMDEAMAAARSETDRELTAHQLDAFHKTFNFCMSCRQYTCPNCWNEVEARCLSCAPNLGHEVMPAPFPEIASTSPFGADPGYAVTSNGGNGSSAVDHGFGMAETAVEPGDAGLDFDLAARLESLTAGQRDDDAGVMDDARRGRQGIEERAAAQTGGLLKRFRPEANIDADLEAYEQGQPADGVEAEAAAEPMAVTPEPTIAPEAPAAELVAADAAPVAVEPEPEPVAAEAEPVSAEPEPVSAEPEPVAVAAEPEPIAAEPEPEQVIAPEPLVARPEPEPVAVAAEPVPAEPEPEPVAAEPQLEPVAAAPEPAAEPVPATDVIPQPTWRMVAPDPTPETPIVPPAGPSTAIPAAAIARDPNAEPQWPTRPEWLGSTSAPGLPFLNRPAAAQGGIEALWAESAREVVAPAKGRGGGGIQPCVSCGLSLSANARFCRRCGTSQPV
jgi:hypothetical protein